MGSPITLRDLLLDPDPRLEHSITLRVLLYKQTATAVLYTYTASLVHKVVQLNAILLLRKIDSDSSHKEIGTTSLKPAVLDGGKAIFRRMKERRPRAGEELKKLYEGLAA